VAVTYEAVGRVIEVLAFLKRNVACPVAVGRRAVVRQRAVALSPDRNAVPAARTQPIFSLYIGIDKILRRNRRIFLNAVLNSSQFCCMICREKRFEFIVFWGRGQSILNAYFLPPSSSMMTAVAGCSVNIKCNRCCVGFHEIAADI